MCLRKLVVCPVYASSINDISRCALRWKNLDVLMIKYEYDIEWITVFMDALAKHKNLPHLCIITDITCQVQGPCHLPTREKIEELAAAWSNRDWVSMFFISTRGFGDLVSFISAIHHGHGTIKYEEVHTAPFNLILHKYTQFYTLFWRYADPQLYTK